MLLSRKEAQGNQEALLKITAGSKKQTMIDRVN